MTRILLVDDEPLIVKAMQRMLRRESGWEVAGCTGGVEALRLLATSPIDVVVSDLNMPGINGLTLLHEVRDRYPSVARFVLSGHAELEESVRAASVAHQFLAKPCDFGQLRDAIARVMTSLSTVAQTNVRVRAAWVKRLPPVPRTFGAITFIAQDPNASARDIAALVEKDVGLAAKVLQLVNGAFFGRGHRVTSLDRAVMLLGTNVLRAIVLSQELFGAFPARGDVAFLQRLQAHAQHTAAIARSIGANRAEAETAFTIALLHDVGKLVLTTVVDESLIAAGMGGDASPDAVDHSAVGACLLTLWGLPDDIAEPVRWHHRPSEAPTAARRLTALVHVADALEHELAGDAAETPLDIPFLEEMGIAGELDGWREVVRTER